MLWKSLSSPDREHRLSSHSTRSRRLRCEARKSCTPRFCGATSGYRFYNASTGRWLSRDPSAERGFFISAMPPTSVKLQEQTLGLLYAFVKNDSLNRFDLLGLADRIVEWTAPACDPKLDTAFIQVVTTGTFNTPKGVDIGRWPGDPPNCPPFYPSSSGAVFNDKQGGLGWRTWVGSDGHGRVCVGGVPGLSQVLHNMHRTRPQRSECDDSWGADRFNRAMLYVIPPNSRGNH